MGRNAKFTKRLTKKEKDSVRITANSVSKNALGYDHDTKSTLKKAAKALGAKEGLKSGGVKTTLGPAGGLQGNLGSDPTNVPTAPNKKDIFALVNLSIKKSISKEAGSMDIDLPVPRTDKKEKAPYVTAGMVDYVDLMNSRNPKKLVRKLKK